METATYRYFKYEPIKWRVLSVNGTDAFLLADTGLDGRQYNETDISVTWETSTVRSFLNGYSAYNNRARIDYSANNFLDTAFSATQQGSIRQTTVVNGDNPEYGTDGGYNTRDLVYLLSLDEVENNRYGFSMDEYIGYWDEDSDYTEWYDRAKEMKTSTYAKAMGVWSDYDTTELRTYSHAGNGWWWLRSPGDDSYSAVSVNIDGYGYSSGNYVHNDDDAIRPALHLNLSASSLYSYAGTVCSNGTKQEVAPPVVKSPNSNTVKSGQTIKDSSTGSSYKVITANASGGTVAYTGVVSKKAKVKVPAAITYGEKKYKVTSIAKGAFVGNKKLKTITIGKNVKKIGKNAFKNCKFLQNVTVKTKVLTKIAKNAFKGTKKKLLIEVPKKKKSKYKKLFRGKGNKRISVR